jgi:hypothetical protein
MNYRVVQQFKLPQNRNVVSNQLIRFTGQTAQKQCPHPMRRVVVWDQANEQEIVLLNNHLTFELPLFRRYTRTAGRSSTYSNP